MKIEKRLELFVDTCMKYLKGLYDLKCIVSGYETIKIFEKYKAVPTRFTSFDIFFLKGQYESNHIVLSPHPGFSKSGECRILKDVMVQLRTIRFNRRIRIGTTSPFYTLHFQPYRNHVMEISRVDLAVPKKIVIF